MFKKLAIPRDELVRTLAAQEYWVAQAAAYLDEGKYSKAVEVCTRHLREEPRLVSGRLVYATALYRAGQKQSALEQFYQVLSLDPDNVVALKYVGDIKFAEGDVIAAMTNYGRILEIDPYCGGLKSDLKPIKDKPVSAMKLVRSSESRDEKEGKSQKPKWKIHFYTETIGDLYLAQGHPRLAAEVYRVVHRKTQNPRVAEKLAQAEKKIREKEH